MGTGWGGREQGVGIDRSGVEIGGIVVEIDTEYCVNTGNVGMIY